jgi:hypothetical protein
MAEMCYPFVACVRVMPSIARAGLYMGAAHAGDKKGGTPKT